MTDAALPRPPMPQTLRHLLGFHLLVMVGWLVALGFAMAESTTTKPGEEFSGAFLVPIVRVICFVQATIHAAAALSIRVRRPGQALVAGVLGFGLPLAIGLLGVTGPWWFYVPHAIGLLLLFRAQMQPECQAWLERTAT